ncbi:MAG: hypothetical protein LKI76_01750 [Megasphaera sp.]|jgi:hypothetical protein|uniref:hypothetical protein n=1 Tax=Megasphaera sueciensis TaxID=349094 RepID=UPI003D069400|nr:hypothetical protein [Megasphaera sp.]MCI1822647.1 hypothetical protein [Megasphaera sp.]
MKISVIGPRTSITYLKKNISLYKMPVTVAWISYTTFTELDKILPSIESRADGILFTGQAPYYYASNRYFPHCLWDYLPRNVISTAAAIIQANINYGYIIHTISIDGFETDTFDKIRRSLGIAFNKIIFYNVIYDVLDKDYIQKLIMYHVNNYQKHQADVCITGLESVAEALRKKNIPVIRMFPNVEDFFHHIEILELRYQIIDTKSGRFAVIAIHIDFSEDVSWYEKSEIPLLKTQEHIREMVYHYAKRIKAAVFQTEYNQYYLASTQAMIAAETGNFTRFDVFNPSLADNGYVTAFAVGIGLGDTPVDAKKCAVTAQRKAVQHAEKVSCYVLDGYDSFIGPLLTVAKSAHVSVFADNGRLNDLSIRAGISKQVLTRIQQTLQQYKISVCTPRELSQYLKMNIRTVNRILSRLEQCQAIVVIGKKATSTAGRPSRMIRFHLDG